ncbi:MAG: Yip1 family protein [Candidatus Bathyarchaeota archaeon]|nr:Yip1 family protein [Candidatus Bathyarchaeota archaeon]
MAEKQYKGRLARIERWLDAVTAKDLMKGAAIVTLTGVFAGGAAYAAASRMEIPVAGMSGTVQAIAAIGAIVMTLLGWVLSSLIYHACAHLLGGKGDRNRMFALSGYATIPALVQQFLRFVDYWFLGQTAATSNGGLIGVLLGYFNVFSVICLVFVGLAIMINYGISGRKAAFVALIPTIIMLALGLWSLRAVSGAAAATQGGGLFGLRRAG